jgi:hypothetical protein
MSLWLKMIGAHDWRLGPAPFSERAGEMYTHVRFPRDQFPHQVTPGDEMIYYAVGHQRVFAAATVTGPPERGVFHPEAEIRRRWPHAATIKLGPHLELLEFAPFLREISPEHQAQIHQGVSFLPMGRPEFDRGVAAIIKARAGEELELKRRARQYA